MSFWGELKRRNVFKVGAAYAIVAWLLVQIANTFFPIFHMPDWTVTLVASFLVLGLPVTLIIAWAFELTPEGVKRSETVPPDESITHVTGRKLNYIVTGLLVVAVAYILFDHFYLDRRARQTEVASNVTEQKPADVEVKEAPKTIAVLPFVNLSPDPDQEFFVDGLSEELLNSLAKIPDLLVTARTSSFTFKGSDKKIQEIASELGVGHILEGSVRKSGNALRITAQLIRAADGFHLWTETYDRKLEDIFAVQEDIALTVASELKLALGIGNTLKQIGGTDKVEAYELYLVGKGQMQVIDIISYNKALEPIDAAIALDPNFALAWAAKAMIHISNTIFSAADKAPEAEEAALRAALKAIEVGPKTADGYGALGFIKMRKGDFVGSWFEYFSALELATEPAYLVDYGLDTHYIAVGDIKKGMELIDTLRRNDPLNSYIRSQYVMCFTVLGDTQRAEEEYENAKALLGDAWVDSKFTISLMKLGSGKLVRIEDLPYPDPVFDAAKKHLDSPDDGLRELNRIYSNQDNLSSNDLMKLSLWAAYFNSPDFSMELIEKSVGINASGNFMVWFPVFRDVRQLPRFKEFVREIGLVEYWEKFGWPDICRPLDDGDFVCD